jgi:poly(3-hydroxybutyrate) depolymerase
MVRSAILLCAVALIAGCGTGPDGAADTSSTVQAGPPTTTAALTTTTPQATTSTRVAVDTHDFELGVHDQPGRHELTMTVEGVERGYTLVVPGSYDGTRATPLVIGYHGWGGTPESIIGEVQRWGDVAERNGFLLVAPAGLVGSFFGAEGPEWAVLRDEAELARFEGRGEYQPDRVYEYFLEELAEFTVGDRDVEFTEALLNELTVLLDVDWDRIYVTGFSLGGWMASRVACDLGHRIAAVAPTFHSLIISQPCEGSGPSVASIGDPAGYDRLAAQALSEWAARNHCDPEPTREPVDDGITVTRYEGCAWPALVEMYEYEAESAWGAEAQTAWEFFEATVPSVPELTDDEHAWCEANIDTVVRTAMDLSGGSVHPSFGRLIEQLQSPLSRLACRTSYAAR